MDDAIDFCTYFGSAIDKSAFWSPLKGVLARELSRVLLHGVVFALIRDTSSDWYQALLEKLGKYIIKAVTGKCPLSAWSLFSWLQENNIKTTETFIEAVEMHENMKALPLKTPANHSYKVNELNNEESEL